MYSFLCNREDSRGGGEGVGTLNLELLLSVCLYVHSIYFTVMRLCNKTSHGNWSFSSYAHVGIRKICMWLFDEDKTCNAFM